MKELTEKEKAQRYDEALKVANKYKDIQIMFSSIKDEMFPELRESENERIRKELIKETKGCEVRLFETVTNDEFVAWLEKQDYTFEIKKGHWYKCVCDYMLNSSDLMFKNDRLYYCRRDWRLIGEIDERNVKDIGVNGYKSFFRPATNQEIKDWLEKQGEQKPTDKIEGDIEYVRTNAFINKAIEWFRRIDYDDGIPPFETTEEFIEGFKKAMRGV